MAKRTDFGISLGALNDIAGKLAALLGARTRKVQTGTSAAATAQTVTIAAPGAGKRLHLVSVLAHYSDGSDNTLTIGATQDAGAKSIKVKTGTQLLLTGLDLMGDDNTAITIDAPAGAAGVTSEFAAEYWVEEV